MTGTRKITVIILAVVIGLIGAFNWWRYFQAGRGALPAVTNPVSPRTAAVPTAGDIPEGKPGRVSSSAQTSAAGQANLEPEPPKRMPLEGGYLLDPFYREAAVPSMSLNMQVKLQSPVPNSFSKQQTPTPEAYRLELILVDGERRWALVNGKLYAVGERVGTMRVVRIMPGAVVLKGVAGEEQVLRLSPGRT